MRVTIYVEGGGNNPDTIIRCRRGFAEYCRKLAPANRLPAIVACGSRNQAFDRFKIDVERNKQEHVCVLLVDSEGPMPPGQSTFEYLHIRDGWQFPPLRDNKLFLMVQAMEAWFLADRATLVAFYGPEFRVHSLPGDERHIETIRKDDLEPSLNRACKECRPKDKYHKTRHAFTLLGQIDPAKVEAGSPYAAAFHRFLRAI